MGLLSDILNVKESYELPEILMRTMLDQTQRQKLLSELKHRHPDLESDFLRDEYQEEHGDRKKLKQDYTPDCLSRLVSGLLPESKAYADICAGTGSLTIPSIHNNPEANYYCEELGSRPIPFLLCNLALRNVNAVVSQTDALTCKTEVKYKLTRGKEFSSIHVLNPEREITGKYKCIVMNPPYSLKWRPTEQEQFSGYYPLPTNAADFAFMLHGLSLLGEGGCLIAVLPHGILFRGNKEQEVRRKLVKQNLIDAIIGLPEKMFLYTGIPVCLVIFKKDRSDENILFIDASKEFKKSGKVNIMESSHIRKIIDVYHNRLIVHRFSTLVAEKQLAENDYNMNIPRYVDTYMPEPVPDLRSLLGELNDINAEIQKNEARLLDMMSDLVGTTPEDDAEIKEGTRLYQKFLKTKYESKKEESHVQSLF